MRARGQGGDTQDPPIGPLRPSLPALWPLRSGTRAAAGKHQAAGRVRGVSSLACSCRCVVCGAHVDVGGPVCALWVCVTCGEKQLVRSELYGTSASCKQPYYEPSETRWHRRPRGSPLLQPIDSNPWRHRSFKNASPSGFCGACSSGFREWPFGSGKPSTDSENRTTRLFGEICTAWGVRHQKSRLRCKRASGVAHVGSLHGTHGFQDRVSDLLPHGRGPACLRKPCDLHEGHRARSCSFVVLVPHEGARSLGGLKNTDGQGRGVNTRNGMVE